LAFLLRLPRTGDVLRFSAGFSRFALITSPELIHRVLISDDGRFGEGKWTQRGARILRDCLITREGDPHRRRRLLLQPSFADRRFAPCGPTMVDQTLRLADGWRDGQIVDARREMRHLALAISGEVLFKADLASDAAGILGALAVEIGAISRLPLPRPKLIAARGLLRRRAARLREGHLVEQLRAAGLSEAAICDEIIAMLLASVDTTSAALAWTWLMVGLRPEVESRLHAELSEVLGGRPPSLEDLSRLPYLELVLTEVMRLYPPVHFIDRRALDEIDLNGTRLRAGEYVLLSPLYTHRDPRFHEEPARFWPERWLTPASDQAPRCAYFPFGAGPHVCIGMGLARREMALVVATLAQRWRLRPAPAVPRDPSPQTAQFPVTLEQRA
jgi:cytochrome P450